MSGPSDTKQDPPLSPREALLLVVLVVSLQMKSYTLSEPHNREGKEVESPSKNR